MHPLQQHRTTEASYIKAQSAEPRVKSMAEQFDEHAQHTPEKDAIIQPIAQAFLRPWANTFKTQTLTFHALQQRSLNYAQGLRQRGVTQGTRVLVLAKPSLDFAALFFALDRLGAVPVVIDPGIGLKRVLRCIINARPQAMIGAPKAYLLRALFPKAFHSVNITIITKKSFIAPKATSLASLARHVNAQPSQDLPTHTSPNSLAAILFTSGSTGAPKGVALKRRHIAAQSEAWNRMFALQNTDIDLVTFPIFLLLSVGSGRTCIIPPMDFSKPGEVNAKRLIQTINQYSPTFCFGSPALWHTLTQYACRKQHHWETLTTIVSGGAPVPPRTLEKLQQLAPKANIYTPYGATEALPLTSITAQEILNDTQHLARAGHGTCVGKPAPSVRVKIICDRDVTIALWRPELELRPYAIGEIVVQGAVVTESYIANEEATRYAKISDESSLWHRMGDLGYFDNDGRLWFCGRKSHKVCTASGTYYSVQVEGIFNAIAAVNRCALVGIKIANTTQLAVAVEMQNDIAPSFSALCSELEALALEHTIPIRHFLHHRHPFPVDRRHNSKIEREKIATWAQQQL